VEQDVRSEGVGRGVADSLKLTGPGDCVQQLATTRIAVQV
jgi:hypothetical protein